MGTDGPASTQTIGPARAHARLASQRVPEGFLAVSLVPPEGGEDRGTLRVCVLIRKEPEAGGGRTITLAGPPDARVMLGCLVDSAGIVHKWLRVAVQDTGLLADSVAAVRGGTTNLAFDQRWARLCDAFDAGSGGPIVRTGHEHEPAPPSAINPATGVHTPLTDPSTSKPFELCTDEAALSGAGLPGFAGSTHRYLFVSANGAEGPFVPVTPGAPENERTRPLAELVDNAGGYAVNAHAGRLLVSSFAPWSYEQYLDALGGAAVRPVRAGRAPVDLGFDLDPGSTDEELGPLIAGDGWLFQGFQGKWGRSVEALHLKIRVFAEAVNEVHEAVRARRLPVLTLDSESFGVEMVESGPGLPGLWAARAVLHAPGDAVAVPVGGHGRDAREIYVTPESAKGSVYRPELGGGSSGSCAVQLRDVVQDDDDFCVEGTLRTQERLEAQGSDVISIRLPLRDGRVRLWGAVETSSSLGAGEWRFRSFRSDVAPEDREAVRGAMGVLMGEARFELHKIRATVHDLYGLMVLGVRTFLVDRETTLPRAVDELTSLAREVGRLHEESVPLRDRVRGVFESDPRWLEQLGPHRVCGQLGEAGPRAALDAVPGEVWFDVLSILVRMVPGAGPDSYRSGFADVPTGGLHLVFEPVLGELESLVVKSRSLVVIDWRLNREIAGVVRRVAASS